MSEETEIDPEVLREEVAQIKDAMGLQERYPSEFHAWLVFGGVVLVASLCSQVIALRELPGWYHTAVWLGLLGAGNFYQWRGGSSSDSGNSTGTKPRIGLLYLAVFSFYLVLLFTLFPEVDATGERGLELLIFSQFVGLTGLGYLVVGEALRAYYIRRRDRWAFYTGGVGMITIAALLPNVGILSTWGYATFGIVYAVHAVASYVALR